jgi:hypothetical protein
MNGNYYLKNIVIKTFKKMTKYLLRLGSIKIETILLEIKKIVFINEMNDSINHCNPQNKFQNLIQFHIYRQYYYLDFFKNSLIFHLICGIF